MKAIKGELRGGRVIGWLLLPKDGTGRPRVKLACEGYHAHGWDGNLYDSLGDVVQPKGGYRLKELTDD